MVTISLLHMHNHIHRWVSSLTDFVTLLLLYIYNYIYIFQLQQSNLSIGWDPFEKKGGKYENTSRYF